MIYKRFMLTLLVAALLLSSFGISAQAVPANSTMATATYLNSTIGDELTISGLTTGQSQWYYISASSGQWIYATLYNLTGSGDWDLNIYNSSGTRIYRSAFGGTTIEHVDFNAPNSGYLYIEIYAYSVASTSSTCKFKVVRSGGTNYSSTTSNYSRVLAKSYMDSYTTSPNQNYPDFGSPDYEEISGIGDCANFVSQVLHHGGMAMQGDASNRGANSSWFITTPFVATLDYYSATWAGAQQFTLHWGTNSLGTGERRAYECRYYLGQDLYANFASITSNLKVGDIIQFTSNAYSTRTHVALVYAINGDDIYLAEHSPYQTTRSLKTYAQQNLTQMIVIIRVKNGS